MDLKDKVTDKMKDVFGDDQRRINHALKVLKFAEEIADGEGLDDDSRKKIVLAAILHDIGIREAERKYNSSGGKYQELEGPPIAARIMESLQVDRAVNDRVCYIVGGHHTAAKNDGIDFQVIWEADLLVNIEEDHIYEANTDLKTLIIKNFKTRTGRELAEKLYL